MLNINKNTILEQLRELVKEDIQHKVSYLPESIYDEQKRILESFNRRVFLEKVIEESISFNKKIIWEGNTKNLFLVKSAEELVEIFKLRSDIYRKHGYSKEFPDEIEGLSFDEYDTHSAIIYYKNQSMTPTGAIRLILNTNGKSLPTESKISLEHLTKPNRLTGEISKLVAQSKKGGLSLEFKYLMRGVYEVFSSNNIGNIISAIKTSHLKLYEKLGNITIIDELNSYGKIQEPFSVISYDPSSVSKFSKKTILK